MPARPAARCAHGGTRDDGAVTAGDSRAGPAAARRFGADASDPPGAAGPLAPGAPSPRPQASLRTSPAPRATTHAPAGLPRPSHPRLRAPIQVFDHAAWQKHRSAGRYLRHIKGLAESRTVLGLIRPLAYVIGVSTAAVAAEAARAVSGNSSRAFPARGGRAARPSGPGGPQCCWATGIRAPARAASGRRAKARAQQWCAGPKPRGPRAPGQSRFCPAVAPGQSPAAP